MNAGLARARKRQTGRVSLERWRDHGITLSPVRRYLNGLTWYGKAGAGAWLTSCCGAAPSGLIDGRGQAWLISAVARALNPGGKADCALVLECHQGAGKYSAISILAGGDWFHDGLHDLHSKDASAGLRGKWIIELPELSAMRRTERVKSHFSRTTERFRPGYGRCGVIEPLRCVFAGTTTWFCQSVTSPREGASTMLSSGMPPIKSFRHAWMKEASLLPGRTSAVTSPSEGFLSATPAAIRLRHAGRKATLVRSIQTTCLNIAVASKSANPCGATLWKLSSVSG